MKAGDMDRRVKIKRRSLSRDAYGEQIETFTEVDEVWGQKLDVTGRELFVAKGTIAENSTRFRIRYRSDMVYTDRLTCDGKEYDITQIAELGRREGLDILAVARVS